MRAASVTDWVAKIQQTCAEVNTDYIDIIVDQSGMDFSVIAGLAGFSQPVQWQSLYQGLPEEILTEDAPLLIRISLSNTQQRQWLIELVQEVKEAAPVLVICSRWTFTFLAEWLQKCTDAVHEERSGIFRFYDPRIFPFLFSNILDDEQQKLLLRPALFWSWLDRDEEPQILLGKGTLPALGDKCRQIDLDARQLESLMCICDVIIFLKHRSVPDSWFVSQQLQFTACFEGMLDATKTGLIMDKDREDWVMNKIAP